MKIKLTIELLAGPNKAEPTKADIQENIDALNRAIDKASVADVSVLVYTKSILEGIQKKLPRGKANAIY